MREVEAKKKRRGRSLDPQTAAPVLPTCVSQPDALRLRVSLLECVAGTVLQPGPRCAAEKVRLRARWQRVNYKACSVPLCKSMARAGQQTYSGVYVPFLATVAGLTRYFVSTPPQLPGSVWVPFSGLDARQQWRAWVDAYASYMRRKGRFDALVDAFRTAAGGYLSPAVQNSFIGVIDDAETHDGALVLEANNALNRYAVLLNQTAGLDRTVDNFPAQLRAWPDAREQSAPPPRVRSGRAPSPDQADDVAAARRSRRRGATSSSPPAPRPSPRRQRAPPGAPPRLSQAKTAEQMAGGAPPVARRRLNRRIPPPSTLMEGPLEKFSRNRPTRPPAAANVLVTPRGRAPMPTC